jgi:hypothetical protein
MGTLGFTASTLTSAAAAFGLGVLTFSGHADAAPQPQPTQTVTAPATAPEAGSKGPFKDAQGDGKYLDDMGKTFVPNGVGAYVPDAWLPVGHAVAN